MKLLLHTLLILLLFPYCSWEQVQNYGNLKMHLGSEVGIYGDFTNEGIFTDNLGTLHVVGSAPQVFNGTNLIHTNNFTIDKASNSLQLDNVLQIAGTLSFTNGSILSDRTDITTEYVEFLDDATYTGADNTNHIDGVVRKTGDDAFVFPTGNGVLLRTVQISSPSSITDHFTTFYDGISPDPLYSISSLDININHVSDCEYWILNRTGGNSNVEVALSWASNSCGIDDMCDLLVARWDGAQWTSEGNGGVTGTLGAGTLVSGASCNTPAAVTNFSPFTLGSSSSNNPLPITLLSFEAKICNNAVCLDWKTASELNNDFFTIEKSTDGWNWERVGIVDGAGNSQSMLTYTDTDEYPFMGLSYYRLKQTDFNDISTYSAIEKVQFELSNNGLSIFPNPAAKEVTIMGLHSELDPFRIYNSIGQDVTTLVDMKYANSSIVSIDISLLSTGVYVVKTTDKYGLIIKQ